MLIDGSRSRGSWNAACTDPHPVRMCDVFSNVLYAVQLRLMSGEAMRLFELADTWKCCRIEDVERYLEMAVTMGTGQELGAEDEEAQLVREKIARSDVLAQTSIV